MLTMGSPLAAYLTNVLDLREQGAIHGSGSIGPRGLLPHLED